MDDTAAFAQNVVDRPEIGLDANAQNADHALLVAASSTQSSGINGIHFVNARLETYGTLATDPYLVYVSGWASITPRLAVTGTILSQSFNRWLVETGDLNNNSVHLDWIEPGPVSTRVAMPQFWQSNDGVRISNRLVYDVSGGVQSLSEVVTSGVSSRTTRAIGDGQLITNSSAIAYGLRWDKAIGQSLYLRLRRSGAVVLVCYDANGAVISGTSPHYAKGQYSRYLSFYGRGVYQSVGDWLWIHPDVASFELLNCTWTSGTRRLIDMQDFDIAYGQDVTLVPAGISPPNMYTEGATIQSCYPMGVAFDGKAALGWRASFYLRTPIGVAATSGAVTITLTDAMGIASGDRIAVELDTVMTGSERQWFFTTVSGSPVGNNVTLAAPLPANVASGRGVMVNRWVAR